MTDLHGRVAIITGGGSGIGRGVALALGRLGVAVVVCGRRAERLAETATAIGQEGGAALPIVADVGEPPDVQRLVDDTLARFGRVDILINNAGVVDQGSPLHGVDLQDWDRVMDTNLRGAMLTMRAVLPWMRSQRNGHIINISSESGLEYYLKDAVYGTSKHALNALSEYAQRENQEYGIRVNTICPGMVVTEMTESSEGLDHARCLVPEDIADLVVWLLTRRQNIKIGTPILIQTMLNPWE
jgi:NAD(P)-dependent dehydrogenase (short-subunit alcohol dehydrogenase family)